jgi:hypothetical protein
MIPPILRRRIVIKTGVHTDSGSDVLLDVERSGIDSLIGFELTICKLRVDI